MYLFPSYALFSYVRNTLSDRPNLQIRIRYATITANDLTFMVITNIADLGVNPQI
jgi:hypothetical protein